MSGTILKIASMMAAGSSLPDAMKKFPNFFSHFDIVAVEAADQSGTLTEVLRLLSEWHQFSANIKGRIKTGLLFPLAVLIIAAFVAPLPPYFLGRLYPFEGIAGDSTDYKYVCCPCGRYICNGKIYAQNRAAACDF